MIQILSGHGYNKHHQMVAGYIEDEECRFCLEDDEETWHVITECPAFNNIHHRIIFKNTNQTVFNFPDDIMRLPSFLCEASLGSLFCPITG